MKTKIINNIKFTTMATSLLLAGISSVNATPQLIKKPGPQFGSAEAGRSVAQHNNYSLLGTYRDDNFSFSSGGAALYVNSSTSPVQLFTLNNEEVIKTLTLSTHFNSDLTVDLASEASCTADVLGTTVGQYVAMSNNWVAATGSRLDLYTNGGQCGQRKLAIFLANRIKNSGNTPFTDLGGPGRAIEVPLTINGNLSAIKSIDVSETDMVVGLGAIPNNTAGDGIRIYSFENNEWHLKKTFIYGTISSSKEFGVSVAIDGNRIVVGDPGRYSGGSVHLYEKINGEWQHRTNFGPFNPTSPTRIGYGASVDIDGNNVIVGASSGISSQTTSGYVEILNYNNGTLSSVFKDQGYQPSSVAISGGQAIVGRNDVTKASPTKLYKKTNGSWYEYGNLAAVKDPKGNRFFAEEVDIDGNYTIVGWKGYSEGSNNALGAMVKDNFPSKHLTAAGSFPYTSNWLDWSYVEWLPTATGIDYDITFRSSKPVNGTSTEVLYTTRTRGADWGSKKYNFVHKNEICNQWGAGSYPLLVSVNSVVSNSSTTPYNYTDTISNFGNLQCN